MSIEYIFILFIQVFLLALLLFLWQRKRILVICLIILYGVVISYFQNDHSIRWIEKATNEYSSVVDDVIFYLDRCSPHFGLTICRVIYNKPIISAEKMYVRFLDQLTAENVVSFAPSLLAGVLTLCFYFGLIYLLAVFKKSRVAPVLLAWIFLYGFLGIFDGYNKTLSKYFVVLILSISFIGIQVVLSFIYNVKKIFN